MKVMREVLKDNLIVQKEYPPGYSVEVEAEFSVLADDIVDENFNRTADGSLMNFGYEFISKKPALIPDLIVNLERLFRFNSWKDNWIETERASTHIHMNIQKFTEERLLAFLVAYYAIEPALMEFNGESRDSNLFCLPLYRAEGGVKALELISRGEYRNLYDRFNQFKYAALNVANIAKLGTVEFRHYKGINFCDHKFSTWLYQIDHLRKFSEVNTNPMSVFKLYEKDRVNFFNLCTTENFRKYIEPPREDAIDKNYSLMYFFLSAKRREEERKKEKKVTYKFLTEEEEDKIDG